MLKSSPRAGRWLQALWRKPLIFDRADHPLTNFKNLLTRCFYKFMYHVN
jgi:hypothetical protein